MAHRPPARQFGTALRRWRMLRGHSQFELADRAGYSQRHVSFLELGRSQPTRESVLTLAETLDLPLRERNALLLSAGFAPIYSAEPLHSDRIRVAVGALEGILHSSRPFPSMLVDRSWNIHAANPNLQALLGHFLDASPREGTPNALRLCLDSQGLRPMIANWEEIGRVFQHLLRRELTQDPGNPELAALLAEFDRDDALARPTAPNSAQESLPVAQLVLQKGTLRLCLFTLVSLLESPGDATLSDLRVETFYPADDESRRFLLALDARIEDPALR